MFRFFDINQPEFLITAFFIGVLLFNFMDMLDQRSEKEAENEIKYIPIDKYKK